VSGINLSPSPRSLLNLPFREKVLKLDARSREYDIVVIGEEPHLAYNRVGLTSFFDHRKVENLYLNPQDWVCSSYKRMIPTVY
jgi:nitrite reductase (NAD(P)H)